MASVGRQVLGGALGIFSGLASFSTGLIVVLFVPLYLTAIKVDLSFGPPTDWQLEVWQRTIDTLPTEMLLYASDVFWPCEPEKYREKYLQPQLGLFETATTLGHIVEEGSPTRAEYRNMIFYQNAYSHWQEAISKAQAPRSAPEAIVMPNALQGHPHG
jgi:hypothetical protein